MRIADLTSGAAQLRDGLEKLEEHWSDVRERWDDASSRNVEENHLRPLAKEVASALVVVQQLAEVLSRAERECTSW